MGGELVMETAAAVETSGDCASGALLIGAWWFVGLRASGVTSFAKLSKMRVIKSVTQRRKVLE
jgi:hypothetical protein